MNEFAKDYLKDVVNPKAQHYTYETMLAFAEAYAKQQAKEGKLSDGYHTHNELYEFRKVYNALLFNEWARLGMYDVHKSKKHHDGELCFGDEKWFIVVAILPNGQVTNHYKIETDWDLFQIPETPTAKYEYDGHTPKDTLDRMLKLAYAKQQGEEHIDWKQLRVKFFNECTYEPPQQSTHTGRLKKINLTPHNVFEWFKSKINGGLSEQSKQQAEVPTGLERPKHIYPPTVKEYVDSIEHKSAEQQKRIEELNKLVDWLDSECPHATMTFDLSHDFAEQLRTMLDKLLKDK